MPIYEYQCRECGHRFEALAALSTAHENRGCPECGKIRGERILSTVCVGSSAGAPTPSVGGAGGCGSGGFG
ncbi:MAG TPA: zinc ribbon domain-containing protein [Nitrospinota bacterium]|jgi:putative FmdB family regulatory protein|nr:zinc ribbon domain-containing protein [Nitrospinota bacterium]|tara:strand:+ start:64197 stop:64409 length:213 start_codon:yes stop_codon:yes gene_type:complete